MSTPKIADLQNLKLYAEQHNLPLPPQWYIEASLKRDRITAITTLITGIVIGIIFGGLI